MNIVQVVIGSIVGMISVLFGIYVSFTARRKGPIFLNTYIFASKEERKTMDIKAEYKLVTIIFGCLAIIFAFLSLYIFTQWKWLYVLMWVLIIFVTVYAIIDAIRTEMKRKQ